MLPGGMSQVPRRQKPVRKGTRSCVGCRKRKLRCVWQAEAESCNSCAARGSTCDLQHLSQPRTATTKKYKTLREKIRDLEATLEFLLSQKKEDRPAEPTVESEATITETLRRLQRELRPLVTSLAARTELGNESGISAPPSSITGLENAPVLSLFDNAILSREDVEEEDGGRDEDSSSGSDVVQLRVLSGSYRADEQYGKILKSMRSLVLSSEMLELILRRSRISICLLHKYFPEFPGLAYFWRGDTETETFAQELSSSFQSDNIALAVKSVLCLAVCIQQLPIGSSTEASGTPVPLEQLQGCYMQLAEAMLAPDDGIVGTIDGLECLMAQIHYYLNAGFPRKSWAILRRAVTFAHLLGGMQRGSTSSRSYMRKKNLWSQMWNLDKSLSLVLGLPKALPKLPFKTETDETDNSSTPPSAIFRFKLANLASKIIDRNDDPEQMTYEDTMEMETLLGTYEGIMPLAFWSSNWEHEDRAEVIYEDTTLRMWYNTLRTLLHLPFALKAFSDLRYCYSSHATLDSTRQIIDCYAILRDENRPILRVCNMFDFHVFLAGMIILLFAMSDLPGYDVSWRESDRLRIEKLIQIMYRTDQDRPDGVASQALKVLKNLSDLSGRCGEGEERFEAVIPYFGRLSIKRSKQPAQHVGSDHEDIKTTTGGHFEQAIEVDTFVDLDEFQYWPAESSDWVPLLDIGLQDDWSWATNMEA